MLNANEQKETLFIDSIFRQEVRRVHLNASVLVADSGKIIFQKNFGYENYEQKKLLSDSSAFQLASASKPFTATSILILYQQGKLSLDAEVKNYLPSFPYNGITVRTLLNHRSGLPNYIYLMDTVKLPSDGFLTNTDVLNFFAENKPPLHFPPNTRFEYCNTNYALLVLIIEAVSNEPFDQFVKENIFLPAHMHNSFVKTPASANANEALAYEGWKWQSIRKIPVDGVLGDKNIFASAHDLFLFDQALNHDILLNDSTLKQAYRGYSFEKRGFKNYGLGWRLRNFPDNEKLIYHNGWWRGYNSVFVRDPDQGLCVIVLCNHYNRSTYNIKAVLDEFHIGIGENELKE